MGLKIRLSNPDVRDFLFKRVLVERGIQRNYTPKEIVDRMLESAGDLEGKSIMVLFNMEILEGLYRKGFLGKVIFISDNAVEEKFARAFYKVSTQLYDGPEMWGEDLDKTMEDIMAKMKIAADVTMTNPPYNGGLDLKILMALQEQGLINKLVCVHPATWLVDNKGDSCSFKSFKNTFEKHTSDLEVFNGNPIFGVGLFVPCVITSINMNASFKTKRVSWFGDGEWKINSFDDVTVHGRDWDPLVKDFQERVKAYIAKHGSLWENRLNVLHEEVRSAGNNNGKWYAQGARIRGNVDYRSQKKMFKDDMYTFLTNENEYHYGINKIARGSAFSFSSKEGRENFLNFLRTDFARLCLSTVKIKADIEGEYRAIPWMDFTRFWTDDELFSELGYHKGHAIREYVKKFLPDYHNLYPNGKNY